MASTNEIVAAAEGASLGLDDHIYNRLLKERIIFLGSEVRDDNANAICAQMLLLAAEDPHKDIWLYINSPGGSVTAGIAIQAEQILYTKRTMIERIAFHTGQSVEQIERDSDRDRWFTAEEAKEYGFVDQVFTRAVQAESSSNGDAPITGGVDPDSSKDGDSK